MNGKRIEQKGRREKKRVWESRDGEVENEWLNMKMMYILIGMRETDE